MLQSTAKPLSDEEIQPVAKLRYHPRVRTVSDPVTRIDAVPADRLTNEDLIGAYHHALDVSYLDELLRRNEGLLHHALKRFSYSNEAYEDLFQVARLGLIKAAQRYDRERGNSFATYAMAIVDGEIRHYLRDSLLIRQPRWARALYQRIQEAQTEFFRAQGRSPTMSELSEAVNLQEEGVLEVIRVYGALNLHSLDEPFVDSGTEPPDRRLMRSTRQETFSLPIEDRIVLHDALAALSDLHKRIIYLMFFKDLTQQEVADEIGMTQRTVSREQSKALARLKIVMGKKIF